MSFHWWSSCMTHAGRRRRDNEDAYFESPDAGVWLVADGMGGHARGDLASRMVVDALQGVTAAPRLDGLVRDVRARLADANGRVWRHSVDLGATMGTTVAAFLVAGGEWSCLWAGDSRIYRLTRGRFEQLTHDHNLLQELVDRGRDARTLDRALANRVTRALGARDALELDEVRGRLADGDAFLVCSDGLTKELADDELAPVLEFLDCEEAAEELMRLSLARGARDNVTLAVIRFESLTGTRELFGDDTAVNYALRKRSQTMAVPRFV